MYLVKLLFLNLPNNKQTNMILKILKNKNSAGWESLQLLTLSLDTSSWQSVLWLADEWSYQVFVSVWHHYVDTVQSICWCFVLFC